MERRVGKSRQFLKSFCPQVFGDFGCIFEINWGPTCPVDYLGGGYISAFLLILFSEIGDKTFFIAVLLSLQNSRSLIFTGTFGALAIMTVISVALGRSLHELDGLLPESVAQFPLDDILAAALLIVFGVQTLLVSTSTNR